MFVGPSGIGKTTLAKEISKEFNIPFISGSMSDLLPKTKDQTHLKMMSLSPNDLSYRNWQALNLRRKSVQDLDTFVSDRSFLDAAAYYWYELSSKFPECEVEHFFCTAASLMNTYCDLAIFLPLSLDNRERWTIEDNHKRITNRYFQIQISSLMGELLADWEIPTLVINSLDYNERMKEIRNFLR